MRDFFCNVSQIEERSPQELKNIRLILGHGVNQDVFTTVDSPIKLMLVLRHPVTRYRSQYDHRYRHMKKLGVTLDSTSFVNRFGG